MVELGKTEHGVVAAGAGEGKNGKPSFNGPGSRFEKRASYGDAQWR